MVFSFKGQINDKAIVDIVTEGKYPGGLYGIIEPYKKEVVQQSSM